MDFLSSIWSFLALMFWAFVFVASIMALFMVIADLFRDHKMNGFLKAVWVVFLIAIPVLTTLVYLIFRGRGMAERAQKQQEAAQQITESYIREVVAGSSPVDQIASAKALLDAGAISAAEFEQLKAKALA